MGGLPYLDYSPYPRRHFSALPLDDATARRTESANTEPRPYLPRAEFSTWNAPASRWRPEGNGMGMPDIPAFLRRDWLAAHGWPRSPRPGGGWGLLLSASGGILALAAGHSQIPVVSRQSPRLGSPSRGLLLFPARAILYARPQPCYPAGFHGRPPATGPFSISFGPVASLIRLRRPRAYIAVWPSSETRSSGASRSCERGPRSWVPSRLTIQKRRKTRLLGHSISATNNASG